jgi:site-specific DNA recombinase
MRAALYARFSTDKQREASIEDQFRECERVASREGMTVVARFSDEGVSGGTTNRKGYQKLLAAARLREFDVLITEDIDRLWRNRAEFGPRSAELEDLGVTWLSCVGDDTRREGWGLTIQIKAAMAEGERRKGSYRTRRGQEGVARAGKCAGGRSYGYIPPALSGTGQLEVDQAQATVVRRIFEMFSDGHSPRAIADALNRDGVPSPGVSWKREHRRKRGWVGSAIHGNPARGLGILNNDTYRGLVVWNRSRWIRSATDSSRRRYIQNPRND